MRPYEIVYIFHPALQEERIEEKLERFHALIADGGGEIAAVDHWGVRQLAYPINREKSGHYVVSQFRSGSGVLPELERILKLDEDVMRYLIVLNEGEPTSGRSVLAQRKAVVQEKENDADEDGEKEEEPSVERRPPEFSGGRGRRRRVEGPVIKLLNYKDVATLSKFMTEQGKILPKRTTRVTAGFQRRLGRAIKRARYLALVPYVRDHEA